MQSSLELSVNKSDLSNGLNIKEDYPHYEFIDPVLLPYDNAVAKKILRGEQPPLGDFKHTLSSFLVGAIPDLFSDEIYHALRVDMGTEVNYVRGINTEIFYTDFIKYTEDGDKTNYGIRDRTGINTKVMFSSENGFFPTVKHDAIQLIKGMKVKSLDTYFELPGVSGEEFDTYYQSQTSTSILKTLLTETPLFLPTEAIFDTCFSQWNRRDHAGNPYISNAERPTIVLNNSKIRTIKQGLKFRKELSQFMKNNSQLTSIANDFSEAKEQAGISKYESLFTHDTNFLYRTFKDINTELETFRKNQLPNYLISEFDKIVNKS